MKDNKTKMRAVMQKCVWSLSTLGAVIGIAIAALSISPANAQGTQNLQFDVFIDANTIYFSGPPGPNPGTTFIVTCVPPLAVRAFIRTLRAKTENIGSASTEPAYSISPSHSPTRWGHTTLDETCTRAIASRRTGSAPRCRHPSAATVSKLSLGNHSLL